MEFKTSATAPKTQDGKGYFLHLQEGDLPGYVLVPGSPERTDTIVTSWDKANLIAHNRQFKTYRGTYEGMEIGTSSTGIGGASAEICFNELKHAGAHTVIRVGTTGSLDGDYGIADLMIPMACIRQDGASETYIDQTFPAFSDPTVVMALAEACDRLGYRYCIGLEYTPGSFYLGQGRPLNDDGSGYWPSWADHIIPDLQQQGVVNMEMDTAGQLVMAYMNELRMGAILAVVANRVTNEFGYGDGEEKVSKAANLAMKILEEWDQQK